MTFITNCNSAMKKQLKNCTWLNFLTFFPLFSLFFLFVLFCVYFFWVLFVCLFCLVFNVHFFVCFLVCFICFSVFILFLFFLFCLLLLLLLLLLFFNLCCFSGFFIFCNLYLKGQFMSRFMFMSFCCSLILLWWKIVYLFFKNKSNEKENNEGKTELQKIPWVNFFVNDSNWDFVERWML